MTHTHIETVNGMPIYKYVYTETEEKAIQEFNEQFKTTE